MVKILTKKDIKSSELRPWGRFEVLHETDIEGFGHKIKRLYINPGEKTSLQVHQHRDEHWIIESGEAVVTIGLRAKSLKVGESVDVPKRTTHRIENRASEILTVLEVQTGGDLSETDILRIEDKYGRN